MSPLDPEEKEEMKGKGMGAGGLSEKNIEASLGRNRKLLELGRGEKVNVLYAHLPDPVTPIEESVRAFDSHFRRGDCKEVSSTSILLTGIH
jgi:aryl-alcohol dehydrogenase-like predicted oxidoreductase